MFYCVAIDGEIKTYIHIYKTIRRHTSRLPWFFSSNDRAIIKFKSSASTLNMKSMFLKAFLI